MLRVCSGWSRKVCAHGARQGEAVLPPALAIMLTQVTLAKPLITLLSKDWHKHQVIQRPNVIQASAAQLLPLGVRPKQCC
jgi:hypothetical protein